jgi:hypothetical protein
MWRRLENEAAKLERLAHKLAEGIQVEELYDDCAEIVPKLEKYTDELAQVNENTASLLRRFERSVCRRSPLPTLSDFLTTQPQGSSSRQTGMRHPDRNF